MIIRRLHTAGAHVGLIADVFGIDIDAVTAIAGIPTAEPQPETSDSSCASALELLDALKPQLRTGDVARRLGVSPNAVTGWATSGRLRVALIDSAGRRCFEIADVVAFAQARAHDAG